LLVLGSQRRDEALIILSNKKKQMVQLTKQPNRVLRRAWGSVDRTLCTVDDNMSECQETKNNAETSKAEDFRRAANSSWLAGPLAGATSVFVKGPRSNYFCAGFVLRRYVQQ
jgi:hypothetical protein